MDVIHTQNKITTFWLCFLCSCVLMFMSWSQRKYIFHNGKDLLIRSCIWIWRWGFYLSLSQKLYDDEIASLKAFLSVFNHFLCVMKYSSHNIFLTIYLKWNGVFETDDGYGCHPRSSICLHSLSSLLPVMGCHIRTLCTLSIHTLNNQALI